jgi:hypothetical protein
MNVADYTLYCGVVYVPRNFSGDSIADDVFNPRATFLK